MRLEYVRRKVDLAVEELSVQGDPRVRLYAAYLHLHTILPEHLPEGPLRELMGRIHDGFTKFRGGASREAGVAAVLGALTPGGAKALADQVRILRKELYGVELPEKPRPTESDASAPRVFLPDRRRRSGPRSRVLILFGTNEGHTRAIAQFLAAELQKLGHEVTLTHALQLDVGVDPKAYDIALLAASLHFGRYQNAVISFASRHHVALNAMCSAFVSVSLSAVGVHATARADLERALSEFLEETQWRPTAVHQAAGAIRHTAFDYFRELTRIMIMERRGEAMELAGDYDMTDYRAISAFARSLVEERQP